MSKPTKQSYMGKRKALTSAPKSAKITSTREASMAAMQPAEAVLKSHDRKLSGIGATEDQMDLYLTIPQRIDKRGSKIEDLAGTGEHDSSGG